MPNDPTLSPLGKSRSDSDELARLARELIRDVCDATVGGTDHLGCKCDSPLLKETILSALRTAAQLSDDERRSAYASGVAAGREEAAMVLDDDVKRHRKDSGCTREDWCESYGCSSIETLADNIRALGVPAVAERSEGVAPVAGSAERTEEK